MMKSSLFPRIFKLWLVLAIPALLLTGCEKQRATQSSEAPQEAPKGALELVFTYGSEKEGWLKEVTDEFNRRKQKTASGKAIFVKAIPMGSGECIQELMDGVTHAHLTSPASGAFIKLGNAQSRAKTGTDLVGSTENLVLSPVVIAMWKPMAEALGWPQKPVGWAEILELSRNPQGWAAHGHPEWGAFKFGHTHPEYSNSGLISIFAEAYAATGKKAGLTVGDVQKPETADFVRGIEHAMVHYGRSTGFFGKKMMANGPGYLSAAVLYESIVIESYGPGHQLAFPIVAIYPKEGTFWSDHPVGVVERDWVTPEHREAAKIYIDYLLAAPQQEKALAYGFRPADPGIPVGAPIDAAHGVDPAEPRSTLEVPEVDVMDAILALWRENKKRADVTLVLDVSGSMSTDNKINEAREGALELLKMMNDEDQFSLLPFNDQLRWALQNVSMRTARPQAEAAIRGLFANGGTALFDAINAAFEEKMARPAEQRADKISAIVVLSDGADTNSAMKLGALLDAIRSDSELRSIRVFTIGYGPDAQRDVLEQIADATQAKFYKGDPKNIRDVFRDISTFF